MRLLNDVRSQLYYLPRAFVLTIFIIITYLFLWNDVSRFKEKLYSLLKRPYMLLFIFYLCFLMESTLLGRWPRNPYKSIWGNFGIFSGEGWNKEFIENVMLFTPYTLLYLLSFKNKRTIKYIITISALTSFFIEICQLLFWLGQFQISDIIHNIMGGVAGYCIWRIINFCTKRWTNNSYKKQ